MTQFKTQKFTFFASNTVIFYENNAKNREKYDQTVALKPRISYICTTPST